MTSIEPIFASLLEIRRWIAVVVNYGEETDAYSNYVTQHIFFILPDYFNLLSGTLLADANGSIRTNSFP